MSRFDATRASAIRAGLVARVAEDLLRSKRATAPAGSGRHDSPARTVNDRGTRRHKTEWVAAAVGVLLIGGIAGGIYAAAIEPRGQVATSPTPTLSTPTATPTPAPSPTLEPVVPTPTPPAPVVILEEVTFTFDCWTREENPTTASPPRIQFATMEEAWATVVPLLSCDSIQHGTEYTETQRLAVERAHSVLPGGLGQLGSLYSQCAMRENGYLTVPGPFAENQAADVRGFLTICPHHPAAAELQSRLP